MDFVKHSMFEPQSAQVKSKPARREFVFSFHLFLRLKNSKEF
tara:strand:- start:316 stop:441 length:126 start_codon:yes stop_codon:yes gene_type:complete